MTSTPALRRSLGVTAVAALVIGNMLGSGIFVTPGELAAVAQHPWQVYFIWTLSGVISLCGALTLAELCASRPKAGATYHIVADAYGPQWGFVLVWLELWVTGPGAIASSAAALGDFLHRIVTVLPGVSPVLWGTAAIVFFTAVNLAGVQWGGRTQVLVTAAKIVGLAGLIVGGLWLAAPAGPAAPAAGSLDGGGLTAFFRFTGLGIAAVLFTYDGWIDVTNVAGEVRRPARDLPIGLGLGVAALTALYLLVNVAFLRVVPLEAMRAAPTAVGSTVATASFGPPGGALLNALMTLSIFGSLGGLVMTQPRLFYTVATEHGGDAVGPLARFFRALSYVSPRTAVPAGAIVFTAVASVSALAFFGSFASLINFSSVPLQVAVIFMVGAIFKLRTSGPKAPAYRTPWYPLTPLVFMLVMSGFVASAVIYRPAEPLIGLAMGATGAIAYWTLARKPARS